MEYSEDYSELENPGLCTENGSSSYYYSVEDRIWSRLPVMFLAAFSAYITIMLMLDAGRKKERKRKKKFARTLVISRLLAACFTTINISFNSLSIFLEVYGSPNCNWYAKSENFLYWLNISVIYVVLWIRQRAIYNEKSLRKIVSKATSFISYATLGLAIVLPLLNPILFSTKNQFRYIESLRACSLDTADENTLIPAIVVGETLVPVLLPVTLVGLFAYPLIRYNQITDPQTRGQRSVLSALRRIVLATIACLVTDMLAVAFNAKCAVIFSLIFRNFSIFSNLFCLVASFSEWLHLLFPMAVDSIDSISDAPTGRLTHSYSS